MTRTSEPPSSSGGAHTTPKKLSPHKSPKLHLKKKVSRHASFSDSSKTERVPQLSDIDRLNVEGKKAFKALGYTRDAITKGILQLLPGSATIVMETIMEINQLLHNYFVDKDSTIFLSTNNHVNQTLAELIRWSDDVMVTKQVVDTEKAQNIIHAVEESIQELLKLATEKLQSKSSASSYKTLQPKHSRSLSSSSDQGSSHGGGATTPGVPLTPREKKILQDTKTFFPDSTDNDDLSPVFPDGPPPPKPPLPAHWCAIAKPGEDDVFGCYTSNLVSFFKNEPPPPLPMKTRTASSSSAYDNAPFIRKGSDTSACSSYDNTVNFDNTTPTNFDNTATSFDNTDSNYDNTVTNNYDNTCNLNVSSVTNSTSGDSTPINQSPHHSAMLTVSTNIPAHGGTPSPNISPHHISPTGSISSQYTASSVEDLLDDNTSTLKSKSSNLGPNASPVRLSTYDNFSESAHEIKSLTAQISQLTTNEVINEVPEMEVNLSHVLQMMRSDAKPPPLPAKRSVAHVMREKMAQRQQHHVMSHYDNMNATKTETSLSQAAHGLFQAQHTPASGLLIERNLAAAMSAQQSSTHTTGDSTLHQSSSFTQMGSASSSSFTQMGPSGASSTSFHHSQMKSMSSSYSRTVHMNSTGESSAHAYASAAGMSAMSSSVTDGSQPPPLPPKKNVEAYAKMFGEYTELAHQEPVRNSVHSITFYQSQFKQHEMELFHPYYPRSNTVSILSDISSRTSGTSGMYSMTSGSSIEDNNFSASSGALPKLPPKQKHTHSVSYTAGLSNQGESPPTSTEVVLRQKRPKTQCIDAAAENEKHSSLPSSDSSNRNSSPPPEVTKDADSDFSEMPSVLDDVDVTDQLLIKTDQAGGTEVRGGQIDALIVYATTNHDRDFLYQEAFLTTYRTFTSPRDLIEKLLYRYTKFSRISDVKKKKLARNTFSLLIRVADDLSIGFDEEIMQILTELVHQLVCEGDLVLAKVLRVKIIEKYEYRQQQLLNVNPPLPTLPLSTKQYSVTDFKSEHLAEQMTLLDAELFHKIEIPEVLLWAKEQNEELSPNLSNFTEHFNNMSFWVRTKILRQEDAKEREKIFVKFIRIMKHLRKINNYNSYLAILAALNSATIGRLEWRKENTEALKELCELIDSTSSFTHYRQALADTEPPCIPYIGMVLQDLTFVHIGNPDCFPDGNVNFAKRWQMFNIIDSMRRFKERRYEYTKNPKIMAFFNNFSDILCEESLWQISESIKPRGGKKKSNA